MQNIPSKNALASQRIALDLLGRAVGERLPTALEYQELLGVGSGTVQRALAEIVESGAVQTRARGHRGTFVIEHQIDKLWSIAGLSPVRGVMPLPNSTEWAGLATGLRSEFQRLNIPLQALYVHGSYRRVDMVATGEADFAVLSKEAADYALGRSRSLDVLDLGEHTYYSEGSLIVLQSPSSNYDRSRVGSSEGVRIGFDPGSYDHTRLTRAEFPEEEGYRYVECAYPHIPAATAESRIDLAVWNRTMLPIPIEMTGITVRSLERPGSRSLALALGFGVLIYDSDRIESNAVLRGIDREAVRETQKRVISREILPAY